MSEFRYAVNVLPKPGILDPQGRAVEQSLPHLNVTNVSRVRVGRRVELTVTAASEKEALAVVDGLAKELLSNPLIEAYEVQLLEATSSMTSASAGAGSRAGAKRP
jgi:phosphoribosylformylglycinamidine synthase PurS subunit